MRQLSSKQRYRICVTGVVQGVGFRPFVFNLAQKHSLSGFVRNDGGLVEIEVEGDHVRLELFLSDLKEKAPPLSQIEEVRVSLLEIADSHIFQIQESSRKSNSRKSIPADAATCQDCLIEIFEPTNRRFRYPFTNCTNCGPRFTIIDELPYDRSSTTMSKFAMCALCSAEYEDPGDRRFHAQPNACPECGPTNRFCVPGSSRARDKVCHGDAALLATVQAVREGKIAAVKGLGGFHLICDAKNEVAIATLRQRKRRSSKPFALMMSDLSMIRRYCYASPEEELTLASSSCPIVLLNRSNNLLPKNLAPDLDCLGIMLPNTPLHHLLLAELSGPIVATSANLSEEPIAIDNDEAFERLMYVADCFLDHNREIYSRYDDSVVQIFQAKPSVIRRSRGYAPDAIQLPFRASQNVLALGPHLKNTFALLQGTSAYLSQHIGDLENLESSEHYRRSLQIFLKLFDFSPNIIAHDLHPDYFTSSLADELARSQALPLIPVQHHHAHIVACMVEHKLSSAVLGVAFDGIGYGDDGNLWGGEFLLCDYFRYERLAHFQYFFLPGATKALQEPWRITLGLLEEPAKEGQLAVESFINSLNVNLNENGMALIRRQIQKRINSPLTSSCGRLFDAVSALLGICTFVEYEGQAAIRLQRAAQHCSHYDERQCLDQSYDFAIDDQAPATIQIRQILFSAIEDLQNGESVSNIACKFHSTVARIISETCIKLRRQCGINQVCLSGGVFQNEILKYRSLALLVQNDFEPFFPEKLPANDGGISLGQAVIALARSQALELEEGS